MLARIKAHPHWRQLLLISVVLPAVVGLAVLAFAWPAANIAPRHVPIGIVGADTQTEQAVRALDATSPGAFDLTVYADAAAARRAVRDRDIYGALDLTDGVTAYTASAASPSVATLLTGVADQLDAKLAAGDGPRVVDLVPTDAQDPRGVVLSSSLLPLTICSIIIAAAIALVLKFGPAWRMILGLASVSAMAGLAIYLVGQADLGVFPHQGLGTWATLALLVFAMSSSTAGLITLIGGSGLGIAAALMVFVGNSFSGATSAPQLLPGPAHRIGEILPPGAGANLLRSVTYFDGSGAGDYLTVLLLWAAFGVVAIIGGHRSFTGFAARRRAALAAATASSAGAPAGRSSGYSPSRRLAG
ncbi:MAG TPA: ABC transporter permease [Marmoricola sp.]|nr:ABC transporter permease [Marmoricola sp.]